VSAVGVRRAVTSGTSRFTGKAAPETAVEPTRRLAPLLLDDPAAVVLGTDAVHVDGVPAGYVTSASYGCTLGRCDAYA
jgi:glycine cleavage system aminomethyltransferase T